jgi:hypothetical protein
MKKIVYSLVTAVAVVAAMVSCSHKEIEVVDKTGYQYRFVIAETDTRATLDDQGVFWEVGDEVGVFLGEQLASANAPVNATDDPKTIEVTSTEPVATVYAYYPYNAANEAGATTAEIVFPASQAGGSVSAMPMAGLPTEVNVGGEGSANGVIHFVNLGSVIDFRIYSSGEADYSSEMVESVTFRAPGMAVSGTATLDLTQVSYDESTKTVTVPEMTMTGGAGTTSATVTQSASVATSKTDATTPIYLVVAPGTYTGTIVVNTNAASYTFSYENREFKRNGLRKYNLNLNNATREAVTKTYEYQTSLTDGETYLIGGSESAGLYIALFPTVKYSNDTNDKCAHVLYNSSNAITTITTDNTSIINSEVVMEKADSKWLVKVKNTGLYMYSTKNYEIQFTDDASIAGHTYSYKVNNRNDVLKIGNLEFYHSGSIDNNAGGFTYYTNKGANNLRFYKLSGSTKSQSIWFEQPEGTVLAPDAVLTYDLASAEPFVAPVLKGAKTTVLYESSNSAIASVDAISGAVTFGGTQRGTVTITATAAGESGYASATASYSISVSDSSTPAVTYYKASALEAGYDYIIAYGSQAMKNNSGTLEVEAVTINDNSISLRGAENLLWTAASGFTLKNGDYFLYRSGSGGSLRGNSSSTNWNYDGEYLWTTVSSSWGTTTTTDYYAYYDGGWKSQATKPSVTTTLFTSRPPQILSFSATEKTYDLYTDGEFDEPVLSGNQTDAVTYSSSNSAIATVDASSGAVTFTGKTGTVTITATAASSAQYQSASASYTISIVNSNPNVTKYQKVTSTADLEPGAKYLLVFEGLAGDTDGDGNPKVFSAELNANGTEFLKNKSAALDVTIANGVIKSSDFDDCQFTLEAGYYLKGDQANKYIYPGVSGTSSVMLAESTASHQLTIAFNNGIAEIANGGRYLVWSTSSHYFSCNENVSGQYSTGICLYKLDDGRQSQTLTFNYDEFEYDLATGNWTPEVPALSGAQTSPLTWETSNTAVATVNASGMVAPQGKGSATITVTAPASAQYRGAMASYELTVVNSAEAPSVFTRVNSAEQLVPGAKYLLVYETGNFVFYPYLANGIFAKATDNKISVTITDHTITSLDLDACLMTLEEGYYLYVDAEQMYIYPASSSGTALNPETTKSHALTISFNNGIASVASGNQYFYYSANSKWFSSTSTPGSVNTSLYMLDDGQPKARNLAFSEPSMSVDIYDKTTPYTLTGTPTLTGLGLSDVTYAISGDSGVASVNASSGVVTLLGSTGTVTVTASALATDDFQSDSAFYTITVTNTPPSTYTRISGDAGLVTGTYLIVEKTDTYVFNASGDNHGGYGTIGTTSGISKSGTTITISDAIASGYEFVFTRTDDNLTIQPVGGEFAGKYMYASSSVGSTYIDFKTEVNNFTINSQTGDLVYFYTAKGTSLTEYLYKKSSDSFFKLGGSGAPGGGDAGVYLYKKND